MLGAYYIGGSNMLEENKTLIKQIGKILLSISLLLWLYPNFIHEPLHLLALKLQGISGTIMFNFSWPAHPYITRIGTIKTLAGGLLYMLLPSLISVLALITLSITKKIKPTLFLNFSLPIYLGFDLIVNVLKYKSPTSDFHFLILLPNVSLLLAALTFGITLYSLNLNTLQTEESKWLH